MAVLTPKSGIGLRFSLVIGKDLGFAVFKPGTTLEKNWLNVSQSPLSLDMVLPYERG